MRCWPWRRRANGSNVGRVIIDWGAGPGGWDVGAAALGLRPVGLEWGEAECATRTAAGHLTIRCDASTYPAAHLRGRLEGAILSTPCPDFSKAGKRAGLGGKTGPLVYEVLRWAREARPRWIAAENVDDVAPIFRSFRAPLGDLGYSVWTGVLDCADYGVPQNRRRAFLLASLDHRVAPPAPTHSKSGADEMFGGGRQRWVSMAEALGWGFTKAARSNWKLDRRRPEHVAPLVSLDRPAPTVTSEAGSQSAWKLRHPGRSYDAEPLRRPIDQPAPCVALGHNAAEWCWEFQGIIGGDASPPETHTRTLLRYLREAVGAEAFTEWGLGVLDPLQSASLLRSDVYGSDVLSGTPPGADQRGPRPGPSQKDQGSWAMRAVREVERIGCSPSQRESARQLTGELGAALSELSHEAAQSRELLSALWQASEGVGLLREALSEVPVVRRSSLGPEGRRPDASGAIPVTLAELGVLQGFPADYPWQGNRTEMARQIGNAVPPPMATALLGVVAGTVGT